MNQNAAPATKTARITSPPTNQPVYSPRRSSGIVLTASDTPRAGSTRFIKV